MDYIHNVLGDYHKPHELSEHGCCAHHYVSGQDALPWSDTVFKESYGFNMTVFGMLRLVVW
jgi:hypothetical protein